MIFRIAVGGIHIESSTFTPYLSGYKDFKIKRGIDLVRQYSWFKTYKDKVELVPLIYAAALPGGRVEKAFFDDWLKEYKELLSKELNAGGIDGILLDIHGAMSVQNLEDAEGYLVKEIKHLAGNRIILSTTMDLHGNVSDLLFEHSDLITCYRTAPHIDVEETKERAFLNLVKALEQRKNRLYKAKIDIPMLLPGEKTSTEANPGKRLYEMLPALCDGDQVLDISIWMGFPWADESRCHAAVAAVGFGEDEVNAAVKKVSESFWNARNDFQFVGPTDTMLPSFRQALHSPNKPFFISDTGDNPGAGGVGDMNLILKGCIRILKETPTSKKILFASIFDSESIEQIYQYVASGSQDSLVIELGGKSDLSYGGPVSLQIYVDCLFHDERAGRGALIHTGNISILITENRFQYGTLSSFHHSGISSLEDFDIIVVKMGYLEPDLSRIAKGWIMALTPGAVSQDLINIPYQNLKRPLFPLDSFNCKETRDFSMRKGHTAVV